MSTPGPSMRYACLSDTGRKRVGNEDAAYCSPQTGVFLVSDGMGGLPAGAAASQIIAHALPYLIERRKRQLINPDSPTFSRLLVNVTNELSRKMYEQSLICHGLQGLGATLVAMVIHGRSAHVLHVGDSRAYLLRRGKFVQLTEDHSMVGKMLQSGKLITEEFEDDHRHLLSQHVAMQQDIAPTVRTFQLRKGDRLLLCSDGLTGPVPDKLIGQVLHDEADPPKACRELIIAANNNGGPDNITTLVVHWNGGDSDQPKTDDTTDSSLPPLPTVPSHPVIGRMHAALLDLEKDLQWLQDGSTETGQGQDSALSALAAAKRLLGHDAYLDYMHRHPGANPSHAFHQVCTDQNSTWRRGYDRHMAALDPLFAEVTSGRTPLCPIIPSDETALILRTLWREYRTVERRYLSIRDRKALTQEERSLDILIEHLLEGVRTMIGLIQFLPNFVC